MQQIIQDLKSGETLLEKVPTPRMGSGKKAHQLSKKYEWQKTADKTFKYLAEFIR